MKTLIIQGSSRKDGDTDKLVEQIINHTHWDCIDLNNYNISYFDYEHQNKNDDFLPLIKDIIKNYDNLVFVTPVYWYAMSGIMKVFFDRITDLLTIEKKWGRKLRGKNIAVISSSYGDNLEEHFWLPFSKTAQYLGLNYCGNLHSTANNFNKTELQEFLVQLKF